MAVYGWTTDPGLTAGAAVETTVRIANPNPFPVSLHLNYAAMLVCRVRGGEGAVRAVWPFSSMEAECGFGAIEDMRETVFLRRRFRDPADGGCESYTRLVSDERDNFVDRETDPDCAPLVVDPTSERDFDFELRPGEAGDESGGFNSRATWCLAISARGCPLRFVWQLSVVAASPVDLLITDADGLRVGAVDDPEQGRIEVAEIPGSSYSGAGTEPETISLGLAEPGDYDLSVVGTGAGPYTITVTVEDVDGTETTVGSFSGQASEGMTLERELLVGENGRAALARELALETVAAHLLGAEGTLDDADLGYLDVLGNENGRFDVGDFRAFLIATGVIAPE